MKTNIKPYLLLFGILCLGLLSAWICHGQTNIALPNPVSPVQAFPDSTAQDWVKALDDIGIHVNVTTIGSVLFLVYYGSKIVRNKIAPNSPLAKVLGNIVNAEQSPPAVPAQPQPVKPAQNP